MSLGLCVSILVIIVGTVCWGRGVNGDAYIADLLHPHRSGWSDQNIVILPMQHLLVHALQTHSFGDVGLVVVVPAVRIPGQRGRFGETAKGREGRGRRWGCVGSHC